MQSSLYQPPTTPYDCLPQQLWVDAHKTLAAQLI